MANEKKFNLVKYVYGRLYASKYSKNVVTEKTWKVQGFRAKDGNQVNGWKGVLYWLKKEGYVIDYKITENADGTCQVYSILNPEHQMYESYLKGIDKNMKTNSLEIVPAGEIIDEQPHEDIDDIDGQIKEPTEKISKEDRVRRSQTKEEMEAV